MTVIRTFLLLLSFTVITLTGCSTEPMFEGDRTHFLYQHPRYHTVQSGETLYSIAWTYGYDYRIVAKWNGIGAPYTIKLGQRIRVAPPPESGEEAAPGNRDDAQNDNQIADAKGRSDRYSKKSVNNFPETDKSVDWQWPVSGKLGSDYTPSPAVKIGLDFVGEYTQPIYAAADGEVVYSGSGLRGYGNLVIIKHNEIYLSAYAHNNELLVKEGDKIKKGQRIATMGNSGTDRVMLHFEIRRDGKPVDPLRYLPKRIM